MGVKRIIDTSFWNNSYVIDHYSVEDKYFYLYLISNPSSTQVGIYSLPRKIIAFETGYSIEVVNVLLNRFQDKYKEIIYLPDTQEISLLNSLKFSVIKGGKPVIDLINKELNRINSDQLILNTYQHLTDWWNQSSRVFDHSLKLAFEDELIRRGHFIERSNQKQDQNENHIHIQNNKNNQIDNHNQSQNHNQESIDDSLNVHIPILSVDNYLSQAHEYYVQNIGDLSEHISNKLTNLVETYPELLVVEALSRSLKAQIPVAYAQTILLNWCEKGIHSLEDLKDYLERNQLY